MTTIFEDYINSAISEYDTLKERCNYLEQQLKKKDEVISKAKEYLQLYAGYDNNFCLDYHDLNPLIQILEDNEVE